jgi:deoxyribonuclease V
MAPAAHSWAVTPREARAIQERLRARVVTEDRLGTVRRVAGVDVGFPDRGRTVRAAVAVLSFPELERLDRAVFHGSVLFPYVPGLLSFREVPGVIEALRGLERPPDLVLYDGHGYAHPRRFGAACHLGVLLDLPVIGVAKKRLVGTHAPVPDERGAWVPLLDDGEVIGAVLRTRPRVKPVYVSVGHRVSLERAVALAMACTRRYRLPEPARLAHHIASVEGRGRVRPGGGPSGPPAAPR